MNNPTLDTINNRTSLRDYSPEGLTEEEENIILNAAMKAPTAGNQMLYSMIIIRNQLIKEKLSVLCDNQKFIAKSPFVVAFIADQHKWSDYYRMNQIEEFCNKNHLNYAPADTGDIVLAFEDTMIAAQNSVIAAESIGIGSCYIGDFLENYEEIRALLKLPPETFPLTLLCFGKYKKEHKKVFRNRFKKEFVVSENYYRQLTDSEYREMFKEKQQSYNSENKYHAENYAQQFFAKKAAAPFRHEMNRSVNEAFKHWNKNE